MLSPAQRGFATCPFCAMFGENYFMGDYELTDELTYLILEQYVKDENISCDKINNDAHSVFPFYTYEEDTISERAEYLSKLDYIIHSGGVPKVCQSSLSEKGIKLYNELKRQNEIREKENIFFNYTDNSIKAENVIHSSPVKNLNIASKINHIPNKTKNSPTAKQIIIGIVVTVIGGLILWWIVSNIEP